MGTFRKILGLVLCFLLAFGHVAYAENDEHGQGENQNNEYSQGDDPDHDQNNGNGHSNGQEDKSLVIQDYPEFQKKGDNFSPHTLNSTVTFYIFLTNNGQTQLRSTTETETVTIQFTSPSKKSVILSGQIPPTGTVSTKESGDLTIQGEHITFQFTFDEAGLWTINANSGNGKNFTGIISVDVTPNPTSSFMTPPSATIEVGGTQQYQATWVFPIIGKVTNVEFPFSVTWTTDNPEIATVDQNGLVLGVSPGTCEVKAILNFWLIFNIPVSNVSGEVTVTDLVVDNIKISPRDQSIDIGANQLFTLTAYYTDNTSATVTSEVNWSSSDPTIAAVNSSGLATGILSGQTLIKATYQGKTDSTTLTVNSPQLQRFQVVDQRGQPSSPRLQIRGDYPGVMNSQWGYIGEPMKLTVYLQALDAQNSVMKDFTWDSSLLNSLRDTDYWGIRLESTGNSSQQSIQLERVQTLTINGVSSVMAEFTLIQDDSDLTRQKKLDFSIRFVPTDPKMPSVYALVSGSQNTTYPLYGGRVHVADEYFYNETGSAYVYIERYDGSQFVQNTLDSESSFRGWTLASQTINTPKTFQNGLATITGLRNETSTTSQSLTPFGYPSYLALVPGTLTWGQIINVPPPGENDEGPVWEQELPPS